MRCQIIEGWFASNNNIEGLYQAAFRFIATTSVYARCERFWAPAAQRIIEQEAVEQSRLVCQVVPAALGDDIGDYAALAVALSDLS